MKKLLLAAALAAASLAGAAVPAETDELLDFTYSALPYADSAMYSREFWQKNVESSLRAREEMPWGKSVPDREFRHFVIPVRVNNEDLDMSRPVFYEELRDRVKNLSMKDAILEINHWCHEKVTYRPSDARTSSPLSAVSQAIGRCGEESTFAVAALRAMCIPARQVYTPRWAHTDDNHAWVEAWADGKWYFLGACEPEPLLNLAWFNSPASRGMLMTTNVFGNYDGPEEVIARIPVQTTINVTDNYAPVAPVRVTVTNPDGSAAKGAKVNFCLYNYSEYYPVASKTADTKGHAQLTAGLGDMLVWATDGRRFGFAKANHNAPATIVLDKTGSSTGTFDFDLIPPAASASLPKPTPAQIAENDRRKAVEDSIRNAYMATFANAAEIVALNKSLCLDADRLAKVMTESRGNHKMIADFLLDQPATLRNKALDLLLAISEKDRRDVKREVLDDHIATAPYDTPLFVDYILNPRVENEGLTPYKSYFARVISKSDREKFHKDPAKWVKAFRDRVNIADNAEARRLRMSPESVWSNGKADPLSASICFVAGARSMGIPARIDAVTGKTQYADREGKWMDVKLQDVTEAATAPSSPLKASSVETSVISDPKYYFHYSISRIENGVPRQLEYSENMTLAQFLESSPRLDEGQYMLTTGQRLANGGVLARNVLFTVDKNQTALVPFIFRHDDKAVQVLGNLNSEDIYHDIATGQDKSILSTTGRGYYVIAFIKPNHEPSAHALNDISLLKDKFEKWGKKMVVLFADESQANRFKPEEFPSLPSNVVYGIDPDGRIAAELRESLHLPEGEMPVIAVADTFNRVVYVQSGYTIGTGETLMNVLEQVKE